MANVSSKLGLSRVTRQKLAERVAQQLLEAIEGLEPGTRVPSERELTRELGVGRSTVREALNGLALLGVVEIRHGQGVFVAAPAGIETEAGTLEAALERGVTKEFVEARLINEVEVARLAALRRTDDDLKNIRALLGDQERRIAGDLDTLMDTAANFNVRLAEAAHNEVLVAIVQSFTSLMIERAPKLYALEGFPEWDLAEHQRLYEAVRDQEPDRAAELMHSHITQLSEKYHASGAG